MWLRFLLLVTALVCSLILHARDISPVDSLVYENKIKRCIQFNRNSRLDSSHTLAIEILAASKKDNLKWAEMHAIFILGVIEFKRKNYGLSDSLFSRSLFISISLNDKRKMSEAYMYKGLILKGQDDLYRSLQMYDQSLIVLNQDTSLSNSLLHADILNNIGVIHRRLGEFSKALSNYYKSIDQRKDFEDFLGIAQCYGNVGNIHFDLKQYRLALESYQLSKRYFILSGKQNVLGRLYNNVGNSYLELHKIDSAFIYYRYAEKISLENNNLRDLANVNHSIGDAYKAKGNLDLSLNYYKVAKDLFKQIQAPILIAHLNYSIADVMYKKGNYNESLNRLKEGLAIANTYQDLQAKLKGLNEVSIFYEKARDYKNALNFYKEYNELLKETSGIHVVKNVLDIKTNFEFEDIRSDNEGLQIQLAESVKRLDFRDRLIVMLLTLIIISLITIFSS